VKELVDREIGRLFRYEPIRLALIDAGIGLPPYHFRSRQEDGRTGDHFSGRSDNLDLFQNKKI